LQFNLVWPGLGWSLLSGGRCSELVINAGLTVPIKNTKIKNVLNPVKDVLYLTFQCKTSKVEWNK